MYVCMYVCIYVCMYVCMHVYACPYVCTWLSFSGICLGVSHGNPDPQRARDSGSCNRTGKPLFMEAGWRMEALAVYGLNFGTWSKHPGLILHISARLIPTALLQHEVIRLRPRRESRHLQRAARPWREKKSRRRVWSEVSRPGGSSPGEVSKRGALPESSLPATLRSRFDQQQCRIWTMSPL